MQVSYSHDHVTHAVIGGGATIDFGISNSAEFFNILSSTLYKDQILAVVREVLCNAWDAHIEAKCTDRPIHVTLDSNKLVVTDYGHGIHHDDIGIIYGTYGNSTKKNDGQQTGGFGLGCKSPFAYTEHFEVTSCHDGVRTIYAMAKSSAQVGGKPGITTIAQFPTTATGLSVSININSKDQDKFRRLIRRITRNGDMNVIFNNEQLPTLNFDTSKANWLIVDDKTQVLEDTHRVCVRYGNVIYPVDGTDSQIGIKYAEIDNLVRSLTYNSYGYNAIIFQAPPHSIAVTPSRESLSMQAHTVATLNKLFEGFLSQYAAEEAQENKVFLDNYVQTLIAEGKAVSLFDRQASLPGLAKNRDQPYRIQTIKDFVTQRIKTNYPSKPEFRKADLIARVKGLIAAKEIDKAKGISFLKELEHCSNVHNEHSWLSRNVIGKLLSKLLAAGMDTSQLLISIDGGFGAYSSRPELYKATSVPLSLNSSLSFLRNILVIATSRTDIRDRVKAIPNSPLSRDSSDGFLLYVAGRKKDDLQKTQQFFAKAGFKIIDLTQLEEKKVVEKPITPPKKREKGSPLLSNIINPTTKRLNTSRFYEEGLDRVEDAEFVVLNYSKRENSTSLPEFRDASTQAIATLFGKQGVVVNTKAQLNKWKAKGVPELKIWLARKVIAYVKTSKNIQDFIRNNVKEVEQYTEDHEMNLAWGTVKALYALPQIKKLVPTLSEEERAYCGLFNYIVEVFAYSLHKEDLWVDYQAVNSATPSQEIIDLLDKAKNSSLLCVFDTGRMRNVLMDKDTHASAMKMFMFALNH